MVSPSIIGGLLRVLAWMLAVFPASLAIGAVPLPDAGSRLIVKFKDECVPDPLVLPAGTRLSEPPRPAAPAGGKRRVGFEPARFHIVELPAGADAKAVLDTLAADPSVEYAEPDGTGSGGDFTPNDPDAASQWHHGIIRTPAARDVTRGSPDVVLAVLDTGINASLPDFAGRVVAGYDFVNNDNNPADDHGHGSAVTAVAAGTGDNGVDTAGVDWNCKIMPLKVLDSSNSGLYSKWAAAVDYATVNGADVINLSAGGTSASTTLTNSINNAIAQGVIFVTITHNDGSATVRFPGSLPQCITVGATANNNVVSSFSNYGPATDLVAPGGLGAAGGSYATNIVTTNLNGDRVWYYGTSFSAPQVAGTATLIRGLRPSVRQEEMEAILCAAALDGIGDARDTPGFDNYYGHGRLDVPNALTLATAGPPEVRAVAPGLVSLRWHAPANAAAKKPFGIEWSDDLATWHRVAGSVFAVSGGMAEWTDDGTLTGTPPAARRFYRSFIRR